MNSTTDRVLTLLEALPVRKLDALKELFWQELNYDRANEPVSTRNWTSDRAQQALAEAPLRFATAGGAGGGFNVFYCRLRGDLLVGDERPIIQELLAHEGAYALYIFSDASQTHWHFVNVKHDRDEKRRRLFRRISVGRDERLRTAAERIALLDLDNISTDLFGIDPLAVQKRHDEAFDVEAVTRNFFRDYRSVFEAAERAVQGIDGEEQRRLFTQKLFNRLMFIVFLERKGWLEFKTVRGEYLRALWQDYQRRRGEADGANFYRDRLKLLFFTGLNDISRTAGKAYGPLVDLVGTMPYLNGGLFEEGEDDRNPDIVVPDEVIERAINDLFYRYNFTITESTPLDVEVAVDPEMLGKIFEELVTGRHESGSYYTPKAVVSFMGREALKGYLRTACPEESAEAIEQFVEQQPPNPDGLHDPEAVLDALRRVTICDPACGSGAYLLGMLQELLRLRDGLFRGERKLDDITAYQRKLEIIQTNLYGVDIDPLAVNIARLRLWLSLIVDFEGDNPPPLPNLDFKIEVGDSLIAPDPSGGLGVDMFRRQQIENFFHLKSEYLIAHGTAKQELRQQIESLRQEIKDWARIDGQAQEGFDWALEFAEVFQRGGFDIVIANPPYIATYSRQSEQLETEDLLRQMYGKWGGRINTFTCFVIRGTQIGKRTASIAYIVPDTFAYSDSYEKVRQHCADLYKHQVWRLIRTAAFTATVRNVVFVFTSDREAVSTAIIDDVETLDNPTNDANTAHIYSYQADFKVRFFVSREESLIWATLRASKLLLEQRFDVRDGVNPGPRSVRDRLLSDVSEKDPAARRVVEGRDIAAEGWFVTWGGRYIRYDPALLSRSDRTSGASLRDPNIFISPKLVSRQTADTLIVGIDSDQDLVTLNSVHTIRSVLGNSDHLLALLAILNSPLARLFYALDGGETREVLPQVHISWLRKFPLPSTFDQLAKGLASFAAQALRKGVVDNLALHELVSDAYNLANSMRKHVLDAYSSRYPRFFLEG